MSGPFSQGTTTGNIVFTSGQAALTPDGESLTDESVGVQTRQCMENVLAVLDTVGADTGDILKVRVLLTDIDTYQEMNEIYATFFDEEQPARTAIEVGNLPVGADVEIEAVAVIENDE